MKQEKLKFEPRKLSSWGCSVEHGWRCVGKELLGHQVVRLDRRLDVGSVDADGNAHQHLNKTDLVSTKRNNFQLINLTQIDDY